MELIKLKVKNYRSIKDIYGEEEILFDRLGCLIGQNNAGKSNILKAIRFLLGQEKIKSGQDEFFYQYNTSKIIEVRGYFTVEKSDFDRMKHQDKRESFQEHIIELDGSKVLGFSRKATNDGTESIKVIDYFPEEEHLRPSQFINFRDEQWGNDNYQEMMESRYEEVKPFVNKRAQKKAWKKGYEKYIEEKRKDEDIQFVKLPTSVDTGLEADITHNLLPQPIYIPPVKEMTDATKTSKRSSFGALVQTLADKIEGELNKAIEEAMEDVHKQLNRYENDNGEMVDDRHSGVRSIEAQIDNYLKETFSDHAVRLEFPNPETRSIIKNANVLIEEEDLGVFQAEDHGEGVKRVLIFSLIRTLADLRQGKINISDNEEDEEISRRPVLILFEEAELFLHPRLQKIMRSAFSQLAESGDQVLFTTHSPFMINVPPLTSINLIRKDSISGTQAKDFITELNNRNSTEKKRLLEIQNVSAYIFSSEILLVEGDSDKIVLQKIAPQLNSEWDFLGKGIRILPVSGRDNLDLFQEFLTDLKKEVYVLTDIDSIKKAITSLTDDSDILDLREQIREKAKQKQQEGEIKLSINSSDVGKKVNKDQWTNAFNQLWEMHDLLEEGKEINELHLRYLKKLLKKTQKDPTVESIMSGFDEIDKLFEDLVSKLLEENILILKGDLEDYYPHEKSRKMEAALDFNPNQYSSSQLKANFLELDRNEVCSTDMEAFLSKIFDQS